MKHLASLVLLAAVASGACTQAPAEQQIVNDAAAALGGAKGFWPSRRSSSREKEPTATSGRT